MIVDAKPTFEVYFDAAQGGITAVVKANYGSIGLRLPNDVNGNGKSLCVTMRLKTICFSSFKMFNLQDGTFMLKSDREIYLFLSDEIPVLKEKSKTLLFRQICRLEDYGQSGHKCVCNI